MEETYLKATFLEEGKAAPSLFDQQVRQPLLCAASDKYPV
jgi:hypothetical protein